MTGRAVDEGDPIATYRPTEIRKFATTFSGVCEASLPMSSGWGTSGRPSFTLPLAELGCPCRRRR